MADIKTTIIDLIVAHNDLPRVRQIFSTLNGRVPPDQGHLLSLSQ